MGAAPPVVQTHSQNKGGKMSAVNRTGLGVMLIAMMTVTGIGLRVSPGEWFACGIIALVGYILLTHEERNSV